VIARVVNALRSGGVDRILVVAPPADTPAGPAIAAEAIRTGAEVITPRSQPAQMRDSIELGLAMLAGGVIPERVVITPGDSPGTTAEVVARLLDQAAHRPECIVVPRCSGRRAHPLVLPWKIAGEVAALPAGLGVNEMVKRHDNRLVELPVTDLDLLADLDTPEDVRRWQEHQYPATASPEPAQAMRVRVRLFALAKERAGRSEIELELAPSSRVADLRAALGASVPELGPLVPTALIAIDEEYAADDLVIHRGATIAVIPPVSGGAGGFARSFAVFQPREGPFRS
jgi:CTP:molybdopterin cytidylyltransferase MocA/molybdopterin converting factor small subunit